MRETQLGFQPPAIGEEEIEAVADALRSGWLTTGPRAALLEERMAEYLEAKHVLAVASGTAALHLALVALGIGEGDEVITTPITWPATANVIVHTGATPVFVDVREGDLNIDPALVAARRDRADEGDPARPPRRPAVRSRSDLGARHPGDRGRGPRGRERLSRAQARRALRGDLLLALRDEEHRRGRGRPRLDERATSVAEAIRNLRLMRRGDGSRYDITVPGYKANLPDVLAAIALVQLDKLAEHTRRRQRQFELYDEGLAALDGLEPLERDPRDTHALHLYVVRVDAERFGLTRDELQRALAEERISTSIHFLPVHRLTWYRERFPAPRAAGRRARRRRDPLAAALAGALRGRHRRRDRGARADPRPHSMNRWLRVVGTLVLTGLAVAYLAWKIDLAKTADILADADPAWFALAVAIMVGTAMPMALRWQWLLAARGIQDTFWWLTRAYFVSYTAEPGPADVDRRRRGARGRDVAAPSRAASAT